MESLLLFVELLAAYFFLTKILAVPNNASQFFLNNSSFEFLQSDLMDMENPFNASEYSVFSKTRMSHLHKNFFRVRC